MSTAPAPIRPETPRRAAPARRAHVVRPPAVAPVVVPPRKKGLFERIDALWVVVGLIFVSVSIHIGVAYGASIVAAMRAAAMKVKETITVAVVEKEKPKPPEPEPEPPPPPPEPPKPKPKKIPKIENLPPPPPEAPPPPPEQPPAPPPPNETPPPTATNEPPPMVIAGLSFSSTSTTGNFAVNVGNTLYGRVPDKAVKPEEVKPYKAERYAPPHLVSEQPSYLGNVSASEMEKNYPDDARRAEVEAQVKLLLVIDDDGSVVKVTVLSCTAPNMGFEEAARKLVPRFRFKPATLDGKPVATDLKYTLTFELPY